MIHLIEGQIEQSIPYKQVTSWKFLSFNAKSHFAGAFLQRIHAYLGVQSVIAILVSLNRLGTWTLGYVLPNEFLRWVDFSNMLILPLISVVASYLLKKALEYDSPQQESKAHIAWNLVFIIGLYLLAASYGDHEVTNYLHQRFCGMDITSDLCRIVIFNDDEFSHWVSLRVL